MLVLRVDDPDDKREMLVESNWEDPPPPGCNRPGSTLLVLTLIHNSVPLPSTSSSASGNKADRTPVLYAIRKTTETEITFVVGSCAPYQPLVHTSYHNIHNSNRHLLLLSQPTLLAECCDPWHYNLMDMSRGGTMIAALTDDYASSLDGTLALRYGQELYLVPYDRWHNAKPPYVVPPQVHEATPDVADMASTPIVTTTTTNSETGDAVAAATSIIIPGDGKALASMKWDLERFQEEKAGSVSEGLYFLGLHHLMVHHPQKKMVEL
jgi:hypothetical protein